MSSPYAKYHYNYRCSLHQALNKGNGGTVVGSADNNSVNAARVCIVLRNSNKPASWFNSTVNVISMLLEKV